MKITNRSSFNAKLAFVGVLLILTLGSVTPAYAVNYHFEEDFSNSLLPDWTFLQVDFSGAFTVSENHTFVVENEELVSTGNFDAFKENGAFIEDNTAFGGWSLDVYLPSNLNSNSDHQIMMTKQQIGFETIWSIFGLGIDKDSLVLSGHNGTQGGFRTETAVSVMQYGQFQHYDVIRTVDRFYVFIDNMLALNATFTLNLDTSINYFALVSTQGSNGRFDNIKITTDGTGLLNEILNRTITTTETTSPTETTSTTEEPETTSVVTDTTETSSNGETLFLVIGIGSGGITLLGGTFYWRRFQKKR
ncbi:MAG: hypothetical protein IH840_13160 [Candidatus Heimdallarchaeota archaeon]|nr:hypothetical protein [Candidatus Heimdallarchaeota archaeon]